MKQYKEIPLLLLDQDPERLCPLAGIAYFTFIPMIKLIFLLCKGKNPMCPLTFSLFPHMRQRSPYFPKYSCFSLFPQNAQISPILSNGQPVTFVPNIYAIWSIIWGIHPLFLDFGNWLGFKVFYSVFLFESLRKNRLYVVLRSCFIILDSNLDYVGPAKIRFERSSDYFIFPRKVAENVTIVVNSSCLQQDERKENTIV